MERNGTKYINPTQEAQAEWKKKINHLSDISLFPTVKSTYMGGSKPDKAFEQTNVSPNSAFLSNTGTDFALLSWQYAGGLHNYGEEIRSVLPKFQGFHVQAAA